MLALVLSQLSAHMGLVCVCLLLLFLLGSREQTGLLNKAYWKIPKPAIQLFSQITDNCDYVCSCWSLCSNILTVFVI